ncbi:uncharacterized protein LOC108030996 [Drosophila biarmipes]|uniref:uncharacterized protein LOC108030996 n=1 Tax=Drosophila biarmipes TaxID=125945 RepID=UPI0007E77A40|nr:uncharacterized protein LOC108030996 [Drosophila biarmipes]
MKFFAILFLLCGIVGFALAASSTTETDSFYGSTTSTSSPVPAPSAPNPSACGPNALGGKKLYFFY